MAQQQFDFQRATRLGWLHALPLSTRSPLKAVLLAIETYLGENSSCWPSINELAARLGSSPKTIRRALHQLQQLGYVTIEPRARPNGSHTSNQYTIVWLKVLDDARVVPGDTLSIDASRPAAPQPMQVVPPPPNLGVPPPNLGVPPPNLGGPPPNLGVPPSQPGRALNHPLNHSGNHPKNNHGNHGENLGGRRGRTNDWWGRSTKITREELRDAVTIEQLYSYACGAGWVKDSPAQRLKFHALARYCARMGNNPGAMLTSNVLAARWHGSEADEEAACDGIRKIDKPDPPAADLPRRRLDIPAGLFAMPDGVLPKAEA